MGMRQLPQKHAKTFLCRKTLWFQNSNKRASRSCIFLADIRRCGCLQCHKSTSLLWQDVLERWKCTVSVMVEAAELSLLCISTFADSRARASQEVVQAQSSSWEPLYTGCWHLPRRRHNAKKHRKKMEKRKKQTSDEIKQSWLVLRAFDTLKGLEWHFGLKDVYAFGPDVKATQAENSDCHSICLQLFFRYVWMHCLYCI